MRDFKRIVRVVCVMNQLKASGFLLMVALASYTAWDKWEAIRMSLQMGIVIVLAYLWSYGIREMFSAFRLLYSVIKQ